jgi:hypothetical protein
MADTERDPSRPTREELLETAASEGLMATEEETDPGYRLEDDDDTPPDPTT